MNEYLEEASRFLDWPRPAVHNFDFDDRWREGRLARWRLVDRYAFAIPSPEAIALIARYSPLVEIGAGSGYWARLLREAGAEIRAYDIAPPPPRPREREQPQPGETYQFWRQWSRVMRGGPSVLARYSPAWNLLLCWPPYEKPMAADCLRRFRGRFVVYIGEEDGCTADETFRQDLAAGWREVERLELPHWEGIWDELTVYERKTWPT